MPADTSPSTDRPATPPSPLPGDSNPWRQSSLERVSRPLSEHSPLISPKLGPDDGRVSPLHPSRMDEERQEVDESRSTFYLMLLTLSVGGLQIAWSVELSNFTPYLLSLGITKSLMALVWIAGPLSGTLVQPYIGILSDNSRLSWGKRKPFMLAGAAATIVSLLILAWTRELGGGFLAFFGVSPTSKGARNLIIVVAVLFVYILDFAINTVQAAIRAFIVDGAPARQQESANAWAGRMTGVGNILGYLSGYVNLPRLLPFFGKTQFQVLCVIACFAIGSTVLISCATIRERDPRLEGRPPVEKKGLLAFFLKVFKSARKLPPQIQAVCLVQFFAWIAWFPFLFYITTYIGQLYLNPIFAANPDMTPDEVDEAWVEATRVGTFALLIWGFTSFASNIILPFFVASSYAAIGSSSSPRKAKLSFLDRLTIPWLTLRRAWLLSCILYTFTILLTFFVRSAAAGTVLVGLIGVPWALSLWAPFGLISAEISKRDALRRGKLRPSHAATIPSTMTSSLHHSNTSSAAIAASAVGATAEDGMMLSESVHSLSPPTPTTLAAGGDDYEDQAGIVLGLHNVAIAAPQIIATLGSSFVFRLLQKPRGTAYDNSVAWVLRISALFMLGAAWCCTMVGEGADDVLVEEPDKVGGEPEDAGRGRESGEERRGLMGRASWDEDRR